MFGSTITASAASVKLYNDTFEISFAGDITFNKDFQPIIDYSNVDNNFWNTYYGFYIRIATDNDSGSWERCDEGNPFQASDFARINAGEYRIYTYAQTLTGSSPDSSINGDYIGTVTIAKAYYAAINVPIVYSGLTYDGNAHDLLACRGSVRLNYEGQVDGDYMEFALPPVGKTIVTKKITGGNNQEIAFDSIEKGFVYSPTDLEGLNFTGCNEIKLYGTDIKFTNVNDSDKNFINFYKKDSTFGIWHSGDDYYLASGYDALVVTGKNTANKTITVKPVKLDDCVTADKLIWIDEIPKQALTLYTTGQRALIM